MKNTLLLSVLLFLFSSNSFADNRCEQAAHDFLKTSSFDFDYDCLSSFEYSESKDQNTATIFAMYSCYNNDEFEVTMNLNTCKVQNIEHIYSDYLLID